MKSIDKAIRNFRQIEKLRRDLRADGATPPELIVRPSHIVRREIFRRKVQRLARLERQTEDLLVKLINGDLDGTQGNTGTRRKGQRGR